MESVITTLGGFALYGGAYAAALATASSFFAAFFFFWTRTGDRKDKIDLETKKVYLHAIYNTMRISLGVIFVAKIIEISLVTIQLQRIGLDISWTDVLVSHNILFVMLLIVLIGLNSIMMARRAVSFALALPFAIVSYFFLFLHMTSRTATQAVQNYIFPAGQVALIDLTVYLAAVVIGALVFNYFSHKVRK